MLSYKVGVASSAAGASAMAKYLLSEPLQVENSALAQYYSGESLPAPTDLMSEYGQAIAAGEIGYSEALGELMGVYLTLGHTGDRIDEHEEEIGLRLADAAMKAEIDFDAADRTVAVVRRDMPPEVAAGLRLDRFRSPTLEEVTSLLNGKRADGAPIGKQVQAPMKALTEIFGLDDRVVPSAEAVDRVLAGLRVDGSAPGSAYADGVVAGATKRFLAMYGAKTDPSPEQIELIRAGRTVAAVPLGAEDYVRKVTATKAPVAYVDMVFSADKSLSVVFGLGSEAERGIVVAVHQDAVAKTMAYVEDVLGYRRLGKEGAGGVEKGRLGWLTVDHYTSRPTAEIKQIDPKDGEFTSFHAVPMAVADPQLHSHTLLFNATFCPNNKVGAIDLDQLDGKVKEFGGVYQAYIAKGLRAHGVEVGLDERTGAAVIMAIPSTVRDHYSKRSKDAETAAREFAAGKGIDWDTLSPDFKVKLLRNKVMDTRHKKAERVEAGPAVDDFAAWRQQAEQTLGYQHRSVLRPDTVPMDHDQDERRRIAYERTLPMTENLFSRRAKIGAQELREIATRGLIVGGIGDRPGEDIAAVTKAYRERGVRQDGELVPIVWGKDAPVRGKERWSVTTEAHEKIEYDLVRLAKAASLDRSSAVPEKMLDRHVATFLADNPAINTADLHWHKQRAALHALATGGKLSGSIGAAGSGKTTILSPAVGAWREQGKTAYGIALAWAHTSGLHGAGIAPANRASMRAFLKRVETGRYKLDEKAVVVIDEFGRMGSKDFLALMRLQSEHNFEVKFVGDPKQCQAVEAPVFAVLTKAFPEDTFPEINTTRRMATERNREIAGHLRDGNADLAIAMKKEDGTIRLVAGGRAATIDAVADLWRQKTEANGHRPDYRLTISAPTNADAHDIGVAVRNRMRAMGRLDDREISLTATDGNERETASLILAVGDKIRIYDRVHLARGEVLGNNSDILDVVQITGEGILARNQDGKEGLVRYDTIRSKDRASVRLSYGYARTIDSVQSITSTDHLNAFPSGSAAADAYKAYTGDSRAVGASIMVINEAAERRAIDARIPHGADRTIRQADLYANIARNFSRQPEKGTSLDFIGMARELHRGTVSSFRAAMEPIDRAERAGELANPIQVRRERSAMDQSIARRQIIDQVRNFGREMPKRAWDAVRHVQRQAQEHQHRGPSLRM